MYMNTRLGEFHPTFIIPMECQKFRNIYFYSGRVKTDTYMAIILYVGTVRLTAEKKIRITIISERSAAGRNFGHGSPACA